jgi:8-amino-7-oxononanoate synthase
MLAGIESELEELRRHSLHRDLAAAAGIDFTSNDYLGLARHPALREAAIQALEHGPIGATASRLLRGHSHAHAALEQFAAQYFGVQKTLFFGSGFLANLALFSTLLDRHDAVVFDERVHASVKEGIHASNAKRFRARHNEIQSYEDEMRRARTHGVRRLLVAVESVYGMDGDLAPLAELAQLAGEHDAALVIDEAHATGIFGIRGRGCGEILQTGDVISVHTCSKALGVAGALVCASDSVIDYLINKARPFVYSTAPPPLIATAVMRALQLVDEEPWRRKRVLTLAQFARAALSPHAVFSGSQIIPVVLGDAERAVSVALILQRAGFDVRAVRPPTVAEGTSRLRVSIHADHSESEIAALADALHSALTAA